MTDLFEKSIQTLELPRVLELLAGQAQTEEGKDRCRALRPLTDADDVRRRLEETSAALGMIVLRGSPSLSGVRPVGASLQRADMGGALNTRELLDIAALLRCARAAREYASGEGSAKTCIDHLFASLAPNRFLEEKIKSYLQGRISRGKVDVYVGIETVDAVSSEIIVNHSLAEGYMKALQELSERYQIPNDVTVSSLSRYPDIFSVHKAPEDEEAIWENVRRVLEIAADKFIEMRKSEGQRLKEDVAARMKALLQYVEFVEKRSPETVAEYQNRLLARLAELLQDVSVDESRLVMEAAIFADKVAVAEETVRLRSHFSEMEQMLSSDEGIGRKLDFIVQEINRETNTIGSKAQDSQIAHVVIEMKAEIEKIREQIQNIE